ncbi:zinc finger protein GAI-ASSOCIATED FACTOR 1-like [Vigna unguiculata]|uniref:zinc finger protein GAI-ASSOCIATED FACTOR 1-like n=1 Tax=Vigna unguiculata TaxID=3917 RepID=UPI00101674B1|nr:zinc finger protein GAI-ASSOCIATED FACTOR 1-like [Vigna unguiculata]
MAEPQNPSPFTHSSASEIAPQPQPLPPPPKRKRNLPGMPDPDAEVIALSPKTLMATNRFVCEICNKGFQRDQNLQLHRRGHNLPWKLRQRGSKEPRKKAYVCPEPSCVHHNPARALGDLTGIKKHFCRKHGEKKWKCERCSKKYAVQSDWKAHTKTCGSREYRCDCGTLFSRRDSFITHRAFCDVLAQESARTNVQAQAQAQVQNVSSSNADVASSPPAPPLTPSASVVSPTLSIQSSEIPENPRKLSPMSPKATCFVTSSTPSSSSSCTTVFASVLAPSTTTTQSQSQSPSPSTSSFFNLMSSLARSDNPNAITNLREPTSLSLSSPLYLSNNDPSHFTASQPALSATALLQKAAQMGASSASLLRGLGLATTSPSSMGKDEGFNMNATATAQWNGQVKQENQPVVDNLGLGLPCGSDVMLGPSTPFVGQPVTRDLLGLSIGGGASRGGLSALVTSFGGNFDSPGDGGVHR